MAAGNEIKFITAIIVNYHAFHVCYMNKCDLTHFDKNRRKSSRKRLRGLLE